MAPLKAGLVSLAAAAATLSGSVEAASSPKLSELQYQHLFTKFVDNYQKNYQTSELFHRFQVFKDNVDYIIDFNQSGEHTHTLGVNQFADLEESELSKINALRVPETLMVDAAAQPDDLLLNVQEEDSVDWREKGVVPAVRNQGSCGSCYAFSSVSAVETAWAIAGNPLTYLAPQQVVDCGPDQGCGGGWMVSTFKYFMKKGGACTEEEYPYRGRQSRCKSCTPLAKIDNGYYDISGNPESKGLLKKALNLGSVSVGVSANARAFMYYRSGVISSSCSGSITHAVVAVGYGTDASTNTPYYIVRNSYGPNWGEKGYVRIKIGGNVCGINSVPSLPKPIKSSNDDDNLQKLVEELF